MYYVIHAVAYWPSSVTWESFILFRIFFSAISVDTRMVCIITINVIYMCGCNQRSCDWLDGLRSTLVQGSTLDPIANDRLVMFVFVSSMQFPMTINI